VKLFGLPDSEIVIRELACHVKGIIKEHGRLYISKNFVCFYSKVFGKQNKVVIKLIDLTESKVTDENRLVLKSKKSKLTIRGLTDPHNVSSLILSLQNSHHVSKQVYSTPQLQQEEEEILSSEDWAVLLSESSCQKYQKHQIIVKENEWATRIYQIGKGSCNVEKMIDGKNQQVAVMNNGEIFGEISFLEGVKTTASVSAADDNTEIYTIQGSALTVLFTRQPALCGRFFQYLAAMLSSRLKERETSSHIRK